MIADRMREKLRCGSAIRVAYNEGQRLSERYGADQVFDLSIGNPGAPPPAQVRQAILELMEDPALSHAYMCDAGYEVVRDHVAQSLNRRFQAGCQREQIIMSVGAAGGLNAVLFALLDVGDEVIVFRPYYPAYAEFIDNWGGRLVGVCPEGEAFQPDFADLERRITFRTKVVLVNSPHNPTGTIYTPETARRIAEILEAKQAEYGHAIYLLSDEPYRELVYDQSPVIWWPHIYSNTVVVYSFSKSLSLPGERIGYVMISPTAEEGAVLAQAVRRATGCLGYVNAPALFQRVVERCLDVQVDVAYYDQNRRLLCGALQKLGFEVVPPRGAFYIFVKAPAGQESEFVELARRRRLIIVGGSAFDWAGYARLSFCGTNQTLTRAIPALTQLAADCGLR